MGAALVQEQLLEGEIIRRRTVQAAAAHLEFRVLRDLERDRRERAVIAAGMHAGETSAAVRSQLEPGIVHANRAEQMLGEIDAEPLPAGAFHRLAGPVDADAIIPFLAGIEGERQVQRRILAGNDARYA